MPRRSALQTLVVATGVDRCASCPTVGKEPLSCPNYLASPKGADFVDNAVVAAVMDKAVQLRASHAAAPPLDILDLIRRGRRAQPINFGEILPFRAFGLLVAEAFDRGMPLGAWIGFYRYPDPSVIAALDDIWRKEVWSTFSAHFGIA